MSIKNAPLVFIIFLAGTCLLFFFGCSGKDSSSEDDKTKIRAAADSNNESIDPELLSLLQELAKLDQMDREAQSKEDKIKINRSRAQLAKELLGKDLIEPYRIRCFGTLAHAMLNRIFFGDEPEAVRKELAEICAKYMLDENPEITRVAKTARVSVMAQQLIADELENKNELVASTVELVELYPDHEQSNREVYGMIDRLWKSDYIDTAVKMMQQIAPVLKRTPNEINDKVVAVFQSRLRLNEHGFPQALDQIIAEPEKAVPAFQQAVDAATADPEMSAPMYIEMRDAIFKLELAGQYQQMIYLLDRIKQHIVTSPIENIAKLATDDVKKSTTRLALLYKPFRINALDREGKPIDVETLKGGPVVVVFFTLKDQQNVAALNLIENVHKELAEHGVKMVAACIERNRSNVLQALQNSKGNWILALAPEETEGTDFISQFGIQNLPYIVMLDSRAIVTEINVVPANVKSKLEQLMFSYHVSPKTKPEFVSLVHPAKTWQADQNDSEKSAQSNTYIAADNLNTRELFDYLLKFDEMPRSIQKRDDFLVALFDTTDRILRDPQAETAWKRNAAVICATHLQTNAALGNEACDEQIVRLIEKIKPVQDKTVQSLVAFLELEQLLLDADKIKFDRVEPLLLRVQTFCQSTELTEKHLRLASLTVKLINRIDREGHAETDANTRAKYLGIFGPLFAKSENSRLAAYGKSLTEAGK